MIAIALVGGLDLVELVSDYLEYDLYDRVVAGGEYTQHQLDASDTRQAIVAVVALVAFVLAIVFFLRWFSRAYRNLQAVGGHQRYRQGWAIGSWFVPFLNLFRPKQIANDIWRGSDPVTHEYTPAGTEHVSPLLAWWWGAFLVSSWANNLAGRAFFSGNEPADIRRADGFAMVGDLLELAAAVLCVVVIWSMTRRQEERAAARAGTVVA
jgi:Domain of unknown function (DUF4328)